MRGKTRFWGPMSTCDRKYLWFESKYGQLEIILSNFGDSPTMAYMQPKFGAISSINGDHQFGPE